MAKKKDNTTSLGFEETIWRAADKLRGNLNAAEYEGVVLVSYRPELLDNIDEEQIGMIMVQSLCDEINYKYANGLNCLYLNIKK